MVMTRVFLVVNVFFRFQNNHNLEKIFKKNDARSLALSSVIWLAKLLAISIASMLVTDVHVGTKCVGDNFEMLMTDLYTENTNIMKKSPA